MLLLCLSDIHGEAAGLAHALESAPEAEVVVVAGDITHLGGYDEAQRVMAPVLESGRRVLAVAGNMDRDGVSRYLDEKGINLHGRGVSMGPVGFFGLGGSNRTPFNTPFEVEDAAAQALLDAGWADVAACPVRVLVSHAPPRGTKLDRTFAGMHVGSPAVRDFVTAHAPHLCISGHIHESPGEDIVGKTRCLNLGPYKSGRHAVVRIEGDTITVTWRKR